MVPYEKSPNCAHLRPLAQNQLHSPQNNCSPSRSRDRNQMIIWGFWIIFQWIGLRENLQETMVFTIKYRGFL